MTACPVCGAENSACGAQPLRYPPLDLAGITPVTRTNEELEEHRRLIAERDERRRERAARDPRAHA